MATPIITESESARFWPKVRKAGPDECWEWTASKDRYGKFRYRGRLIRSHRLAWMIENGPIPGDMRICHSCDNPPCCNPRHLFLGTMADNIADRDMKGRRTAPRGDLSTSAKLTNQEAMTVYKESMIPKADCKKIAAKYGISKDTVWLIRKKKRYAIIHA